ncbi:GNAT family N-acetyltransferase [Defluviimonas sp. D31]|uniref:GNAT family N-acetyltransferase n=1 Tax=Defluviimonas sp. D31 TaxID=3083253 RepID=UPI00296F7DC2|nr:GNAT family N-acetyltransferase [Defluviimonas sp. D31]MDW4550911.1 GNAT family N-acetyltransferase [Defluviimonas sp. D31]
MEILTERLRVRAYTLGDQREYVKMNSDSEIMRWLGGPSDNAQSIAEMEYNNATLANFSNGKVAVERLSDGVFLGMCGLSFEDWYPDDLEIGWRFQRQHWGFGYATEAALAWLHHAFLTLGIERVISISDAPNLRSISVMRRLNMKLNHVAELGDRDRKTKCLIYAITKSEFRERPTTCGARDRQGRR